jgi:putative PIN family toxin of toxin-antitoxin system
MLIVLDTNVLYQALRNKNGASHFILKLIRERKINIALSIPVFNEYEDVLKRNKSLNDFDLELLDIDKVLDFLAFIGKPYNTYFLWRPNLKDEKDNMFIELAVTSNSPFIITSNIKDFTINKELKFDEIKIITPSEFVKYWRENYED